MEAFLASRLGTADGTRLSSLLQGICGDDLVRFATLTENIILVAAQTAAIASGDAISVLGLARQRT